MLFEGRHRVSTGSIILSGTIHSCLYGNNSSPWSIYQRNKFRFS